MTNSCHCFPYLLKNRHFVLLWWIFSNMKRNWTKSLYGICSHTLKLLFTTSCLRVRVKTSSKQWNNETLPLNKTTLKNCFHLLDFFFIRSSLKNDCRTHKISLILISAKINVLHKETDMIIDEISLSNILAPKIVIHFSLKHFYNKSFPKFYI